MNSQKFKLAGLIAAAAFVCAGHVQAQLSAVLTDFGISPPIPAAYDAYQLATPGGANSPDGLNYYFDNSVPPGQTFTTGTNANGFILNSLSIRTAGDSGGLAGGGQSYTLRLYSVAGNAATLLATYVSQPAFTYTSTHWLQWGGLGLGLQPNKKYAYTFSRNSAGWENLANVGGNLYTNGEVALIPAAGGTITYGGSHNYDASFFVGMGLATSLVANPPVISPSSSVAAGAAVAITTSAAGPGPLGYQWRTDGGSGGTLTNIPGANSLSLPVSTIGMALGDYKYAVVVTNASQAVTSSIVTLTLNVGIAGTANLYDTGSSSFTPWPNSISQLAGGGNGNGLNYYNDNDPMPGQTFTTGTNVFGYTLASLTIGTGGGSSSGTGTAQGYSLYIYSVSNNQATVIAVLTDSSASFTYGNWLTWDSIATLILNPNSTYAYAFRRNASGYAGMASSPGATDLYPGGQICLIPPGGGAITYGTNGLVDAAFSVELKPVRNKTFWDYDEFSDSFWKIINRANDRPLISSAVGSSQTHAASFGIEEEFQVLYNFEDDTYKLRAHDTWQCIEAKNAAMTVGTAVVENPNYANAAHQHWRLIDVGSGYYMIANLSSGLVLETDDGLPASVKLANPVPGNTRQQWRFDYFYHYPKKGIGQGNPDWNRFGLSWAYDWSKFTDTSTYPPHFNYAPMQHRVGWDGLEENMATDCAPMLTNSKPVFLLGYNEGDRPDQANFPAYQAVEKWPYFLSANMPLVSPVTSLGGEWGWLRPFYEGCWSAGYRVDYSAMHWYSSPSASAVLDHAQWIYNNWGNRVWITEFCNIAFGFTGTWSEEDAYDQLQEYLWRAEDHHPTARHAWFPQNYPPNAQTWDRWGVNAAMYAGDWNTLTPLGEMWGAFDGDRTIHTQQPYYLHSRWQSQRVTARTGSNTVDHSTIRFGGAEQQIALIDAGSGKYYIQTALDGRRLGYNGSALSWVEGGTTGIDVEWTVTSAGWGYYWVNNPGHSVTLRGRCWRDGYGEPYSIYYDVDTMGNPSSGNETMFRFIKPYFAVNLNSEVSRYGFEGNADDQTAMKNHGKISSSGVSFVAGNGGGQAVQFDGTSGYIQTGARVLQQKPWSPNTSFTISFWMKTTQTGGAGTKWTSGAGLVDGDVAGAASDFGISLVGNKVAFGCGKGVADSVAEKNLISTAIVNNGQWHHIAATRRSDGAMELFVDGNSQATGSGPTQNRFSPELLRFGCLLSGSNYYNGALDDVRIFAYALHSSQVAALFTNNVPAPWIVADVGSPGYPGYASIKSGIWTVGGGGSDIGSQWDQFHFLHQPAAGDKALIARITSLPTTWDGKSITNSKIGLMFRESTAAGSKFVNLAYNHSQGLQLQYRGETNAPAGVAATIPTSSAPFWLKLERFGNVFVAYRAVTPGAPTDSEWVYIGVHTNTMSTNALAGVAATSRDNNTISRASLTSLQLNSAVLSPGAAWRMQKFGSPANVGNAADSADYPDADGINNLWERAFGYEPTVVNTNAWPYAGIESNYVTLTYRRSTAATDMLFQTVWSSNFNAWSSDQVTDSLLSVTNGVETRRSKVPMNSRDYLFLRLQLTPQP